jgi:hypothetical protein
MWRRVRMAAAVAATLFISILSLRKISFAFVMVVPLFTAVPKAMASVLYSYAGNPFTTFSSMIPGPPVDYDAGGSVSGEFTVASALGDNFSGNVTPTQFSFSNQLFVITNNTSQDHFSFYIQTSDNGPINQWTINLFAGDLFGLNISTSNSGDSTSSIGPTTFIEASNNDPGSWSYKPSLTPLPSSLSLFALGLGAIGLLGWRRRRKA